jgi:hypothetical protein
MGDVKARLVVATGRMMGSGGDVVVVNSAGFMVGLVVGLVGRESGGIGPCWFDG